MVNNEILIPRVTSKVFVEEYLPKYKPAIITDVVTQWKAYELWSPDYLCDVYKSKTVSVAVARKKSPFGYDRKGDSNFKNLDLKFTDAIAKITENVESDVSFYLMRQNMLEHFPEILRDIQVPPWIGDRVPDIHLWVGNKGNCTPLHFDNSNNFFAQIYGSKKFLLFDPFQVPYLYPHPPESDIGHFSYLDIEAEKPEFNGFEKFKDAIGSSVQVDRGELLFVPSGWWHQVTTLETALSVSIWWQPNDFKQFMTPTHSRYLWKAYRNDKLKSFYKKYLLPNGKTFFDAAQNFLEVSTGAAALLIGAALVDILEKLGVHDSDGDNLIRRSKMMQSPWCAKLPLTDEEISKLNRWCEIVDKAYGGEEFTRIQILTLFAEVKDFAFTTGKIT